MKEYTVTIKIYADTIRVAANNNSWEPSEVYRTIWNSIRNATRQPETIYPARIDDYFLTVAFMEGGNLLTLLTQIREDLEHNLKLKPEEVKLSLIDIKDRETGRQIF